MEFFQMVAWVIVIIFCLCVAPLMTIGGIFFAAGWDVPGSIFLLLGVVNMFVRIANMR